MPKPVNGAGDPNYPRWATVQNTETIPIDGVLSTVSTKNEPPSEFKDEGLTYRINFPYDYVNYQFNLIDQWVEHIDTELDQKLTETTANPLYLRRDQNLADLGSAPAARTFLDVLTAAEISALISTAVDNLVSGAPGALNTLNELAAALGDDQNFSATVTGLINEKINANTFVGAIFPRAGIGTPPGTILCDGRAVDRTTYAALFSTLGTEFGAGNGTTTFNVPDLRGEFIRGYDGGRGVDTGRAIFSSQTDAVGPHQHFTVWDSNTVVNPNSSPVNASRTTVRRGETGGESNYNLAGSTNPATGGLTSNNGTDTETRPRNIALPYYIVY